MVPEQGPEHPGRGRVSDGSTTDAFGPLIHRSVLRNNLLRWPNWVSRGPPQDSHIFNEIWFGIRPCLLPILLEFSAFIRPRKQTGTLSLQQPP
jgi:hypothetical protein